jgi:hypothetical protein
MIQLSESQTSAVHSAAQALCPSDRDAFLAAVAEQLAAQVEIGDGCVHRAICTAFSTFWHPPAAEIVRATSRWSRAAPNFAHASKR